MDTFNINEKLDVFQGINNLESAQATSIKELCDVTSELYSFLLKIDSQEDSWMKLKRVLEMQAPFFIPKVRMAFLYYYSTCLQKVFVPSEEIIKSPQTNLKNMQKLNSFIKDSDNRSYKYFKYLLTESLPGMETDEIASTFIDDMMTVHTSGENPLLNVGRNEGTPSNLSLDDLLHDFSEKAGAGQSFQVRDLENRKKMLKAEKEEGDPVGNILGILYTSLNNCMNTGSFLNFNLDIDNDLTKAFNRIKDNGTRNRLREFLKSHSNLQILNGEDSDSFLREFHEEVVKPDLQSKAQKAQKESMEKDRVASKENLRALAIADYITGRISAEEFRNRDFEISNTGIQLEETQEDGV